MSVRLSNPRFPDAQGSSSRPVVWLVMAAVVLLNWLVLSVFSAFAFLTANVDDPIGTYGRAGFIGLVVLLGCAAVLASGGLSAHHLWSTSPQPWFRIVGLIVTCVAQITAALFMVTALATGSDGNQPTFVGLLALSLAAGGVACVLRLGIGSTPTPATPPGARSTRRSLRGRCVSLGLAEEAGGQGQVDGP
jgi:hypothetical protein